MAVYGNLKDYKFTEGEDDIRGSDVYGANGEKLGAIDDVVFDPLSGELKYVVIDTGGWLSSKKFLVPARQIMEDDEDGDFHVSLTKEQVERFPKYEEKELHSEERWRDYEKRYHEVLTDGPVLHREGSTHTITPTPEELPATGKSNTRASGEPFRGIAHDMPRFGATSSSASSTGHESGLFSEEGERPSVFEKGGAADRAPSGIGKDSRKTELDRYSESERVVDDGERPEELTPRLRQDRAERMAEGGRRFREFQERLRRDRESILKRRDRGAA